jgi:hypothetical protein
MKILGSESRNTISNTIFLQRANLRKDLKSEEDLIVAAANYFTSPSLSSKMPPPKSVPTVFYARDKPPLEEHNR